MKFDIKARFGGVFFTADIDAKFETSSEAIKLGEAAKIKFKRDADLRGAYLRGADLGGADLGGADLRGAYLRGAYLGSAYLRGADLGGADLGGADLRGAYLRGADLGSAYLRGADLGGAYLGSAYLRGADLGGAYLGGADLGGADLGGADLGGADLRGADLRGAYLRGADLGGAYLGENKTLKLLGTRPMIQAGPMGSRQDYVLAFLTDAGIYVRAGCFFDTIDKFEAQVASVHGENNHGMEYKTFIAMAKAHFAIWPKE